MTKRAIPERRGDRTRLRLLTETDLPTTLAWRNQDHIRRWFFHPEVITLEQHLAWYDRYRDRDDDFVFVIEETSDLQRPVGQVSLYRIDWAARRAEYGRLIIGDAEASGRGLAREATRLVLEIAFEVLGLEEVHLEVLTNNVRAIAVYDSCGFEVADRKEGVLMMARSREA
jgi:RimJ/RimL family protein N-acetyltransferase